MMPPTCPNCGAQNPEGTVFCQQCGTVLPVAGQAAAPPPPGRPITVPLTPPPPQVPQVPPVPPVAAPAVAPPRSGAPAHRLPLATILGSMVGVLGLVAAGAILFGRPGTGPTPLPVAPTVAPQPTIAPAPTIAAAPTTAPRPTPQPTTAPAQPSPAAVATDTTVPPPPLSTSAPQPTSAPPDQPTSAPPNQPTPLPGPPSGGGGGQTFTASVFSVQVPQGWQVAGQDQNDILLRDPANTGALLVSGGTASSPTTAQNVLQLALANLQKSSPDAQACGQAQPETVGGIQGSVQPICLTVTPQGGASVSAIDLLWAGTSASGNSAYLVGQETAQSNAQTFVTAAAPVLKTLQWTGS